MLCVEFLKDIYLDIDILSCEETLRFSAYEDDGIFLAITAVFKLKKKPQQGKYLYAIHPRTLDNIRLASIKNWQGKEEVFEVNGKQYDFPVQHIYSKICHQRMTEENGLYHVKLFEEDKDTENKPIPEKIISVNVITENKGPLHIENLFKLKGAKNLYQPYTCLKISGLDKLEVETNYIFRIYCHISDPSFSDLVVSDKRTQTRLYRVYGAKFVNECIKTVHIPDALKRDKATYQGHEEFYSKEDVTIKRIVPEQYSITAVDNFNCNPARLHCLNLTDHLWDVTSHADKEVYNHKELENLKEEGGPRIHWFVNCSTNDLFYLQLRGPIAILEGVK